MRNLARPAVALVRAVSHRFDACLRADAALAIDVDAARTQHACYVDALRDGGIAIEWIADADAHPDGCFVEDTAVLRSSGCELIELPEELGANVVCLGDGVLASASAPRTVAVLRERGHRVVVVDVSELHKGDGALTCLSVRIPPAGAWSA